MQQTRRLEKTLLGQERVQPWRKIAAGKGIVKCRSPGGGSHPRRGLAQGSTSVLRDRAKASAAASAPGTAFPAPPRDARTCCPLGTVCVCPAMGTGLQDPALLLTWQLPSHLPSLGMMLGPPYGHLSQGRGLWSSVRGLPRL